ncbi:MAG: 23S rRNA (uracil(1939)-C(5))-methyltransferase RlmD [Gammaproteobacteria bacterium]
MGKRRRRNKVPQGIFQAEIHALSHEGRGIAQIDGKTTFIDNALPGETVEFSYTGTRSRFDEGVASKILNASEQRVTPGCEYFGYCGGCSMQHMSPAAQLAHKQDVLLEQLQHVGKVTPAAVMEPLTGPAWGYRHKARLAVKHVIKKEKTMVGFREKGSPFVADIASCEVLHPNVGKQFTLLQALINSLSIYNQVPQIEVAVGDDATALVIRHLAPFIDDDIEKLQAFEQQHGFRLFLQPGGYDSVERLAGYNGNSLSYDLPDWKLKLDFLPTDFTQINTAINRSMIARALDLLELNGDDKVLDLFCGIGNFTLPMATIAHKVIGVEGDAGLIERARVNAETNGIGNAEFHVANLTADDLVYPFMQQQYNKLLLDPPRTGAKEILSALNLKGIDRIVYVSCNPATLARDAGILVNDKGYKLLSAGVMDMFPHTAHVESIAVFTK